MFGCTPIAAAKERGVRTPLTSESPPLLSSTLASFNGGRPAGPRVVLAGKPTTRVSEAVMGFGTSSSGVYIATVLSPC